jgi:hypothetical protein
VLFYRRRAAASAPASLSQAEQRRLKRLLDDQ